MAVSVRHPRHPQAQQLARDFLLLPARGGGNCFYLSYTAGFLHHLRSLVIKGNGPCPAERLSAQGLLEEFIEKLRLMSKAHLEEHAEHPNHVAVLMDTCHHLIEDPSMELLFGILMDTKVVASMVAAFRQFAVHQLYHNTSGLHIDNGTLVAYAAVYEDVMTGIAAAATPGVDLSDPASLRRGYCLYQVP